MFIDSTSKLSSLWYRNTFIIIKCIWKTFFFKWLIMNNQFVILWLLKQMIILLFGIYVETTKNKIGRMINATWRRDDGNDLKSSVQSSHDSRWRSWPCRYARYTENRAIVLCVGNLDYVELVPQTFVKQFIKKMDKSDRIDSSCIGIVSIVNKSTKICKSIFKSKHSILWDEEIYLPLKEKSTLTEYITPEWISPR